MDGLWYTAVALVVFIFSSVALVVTWQMIARRYALKGCRARGFHIRGWDDRCVDCDHRLNDELGVK